MSTVQTKTPVHYFKIIFTGLILMTLFYSCSGKSEKASPDIPEEQVAKSSPADQPINEQVIIWNIKAIHPEGRTLDVKALDKEGNIYAVKAIQDAGQRQLMDVKAFFGEKVLDVKILPGDAAYLPVKAIGDDGTIYDIKALSPNGDKLDVKGVRQSGNIIDIKAITGEGMFLGVKALSPEGQLNDVKGVKMSKETVEDVVHGVEIHAHVKALPQIN